MNTDTTLPSRPANRAPARQPLRGLLAIGLVLAATASASSIPESAYAGLDWRLVGPFRGGWATAVAGVPGDAATFYFGAADGGVWKTEDAGSTWHPLFDQQGSASIGALEVAASDPSVLWVGTGQIHQRWDIVDGDGVYRSTDGGATWTHRGLEATRHIGDLWVDPRDARIAVVAALGPVFGPSEQRGLFRTEDGGESWEKVLYRNERTGGADLAGDPAHPDVLFASLWEIERHPWLDYFQATLGTSSGIFRSLDGGKSWQEVEGEGLPTAEKGRIELDVARGTGARRVWALVDAEEGAGLYRSDDRGATWAPVNDDPSLASDYMSGVFADPEDGETLWVMGVPLRRSRDGGATFEIVRSSPGGDDYHDLWIDPTNPQHLIVGADQGAVITLNGGRSWSSWYNQPTGQFYRLAVDEETPYRIYSGQQDSGTVRIASRSDYGQITFRDWMPVGGHERDGNVPDPRDASIVYGAGLGSYVSRWDERTGQVRPISPWPESSYAERPGTTRYRYDWITPIAISPLEPHALYVGAQLLFRSLDGGGSWQPISPDLTGAVAGQEGCEGEVPVELATACGYGAIFGISPSPLDASVLWVGTTNGRVHLSRDGGGSWTEVTPPSLEDWTKVNFVDASHIDPGTAFVVADAHRRDDRRPLAWRTRDFGATWTEIGEGLPADEWLGVLRQDSEVARLLYAGTNRGVYVSFDDGGSWQSLQLDLPTTGINDLLVHRGDLIVATEGRAIWILDDVSPLRFLASKSDDEGPALAPPSKAVRLRFNQNQDTPLPPEEPRGENPPAGAVLDYWLPVGSTEPVEIAILTENGELIRRFRSDRREPRPEVREYVADLWRGEEPLPGAGAGHHRFVWDLRYPRPRTFRSSYSIAAVPGLPANLEPHGAFVLPGSYRVRLEVGDVVRERDLEVVLDPRVEVSREDLVALSELQGDVTARLEAIVDRAEAEPSPEIRAVASALSGLLVSLGSSDEAPTAAQRAFFAETVDRLGAPESDPQGRKGDGGSAP